MIEPQDLAGRTIGKYTIIEQLGKGGMGIVYKGRDTVLNRTVALKVLPKELLSEPSMVARFRREAEAAANLNHPNIVSVYDVGEEEGVQFIAMEFVDGPSLSAIIAQQGWLQPERALDIIDEVAQGLAVAHEAGLVHRDIKPGNILIDGKGHAKIVDFGLVQADDSTRITSTGTLLGTVRYMSPEQCRGERLDSRSDLFSLGVVLYRMLSGKLPFNADTPVATTHQIVEEDPVPIHVLRPDLLPSLCKIVARMMAKDVEKRYQTADELRQDVAKCREMMGSVTIVRDGWHAGLKSRFRTMLRKRWFRHLARLTAAIVAVAVIASGYTVWRYTQLGNLVQEAEAYFDRGMAADAARGFERVLRMAPDHREAKLGMAYCLVEMGEFGRAEQTFGEVGPQQGHRDVGLAAIKYAQGDYDKAEELCNKAAQRYSDNGYVHTILGNIHFVRGDVDKAIQQYELALRKRPRFTWQQAATHINLGRAYADKGEYNQAMKHYIRAAETENPRYLTEYALALQKTNQYEDAMTQVDRALKTDPQDELAALLKAQIEQRMALEADEHRSEEFRERLNELVKMYGERRQAARPEFVDDWTSRPAVLSLAIGDLSGAKLRAGFKDLVVARLTQLLSAGGRVQPVEREIINQLMQELQLGSSDLVDQDTALRLGRLFAASLVGIGKMGLFDNKITVTLDLIETETSLKKIGVTVPFEKATGITEMAQTLADKITDEIVRHYPLKAKVTELKDEEASFLVNIGSKQGLKQGTEMALFAAATDGKGATIRGRQVGRAIISSVDQNQAVARTVEGSGEVETGMLLLELPDAS